MNRLDKKESVRFILGYLDFATLSTYTARGEKAVSFNFMVDYLCDGILFQRERIYLLPTLFFARTGGGIWEKSHVCSNKDFN